MAETGTPPPSLTVVEHPTPATPPAANVEVRPAKDPKSGQPMRECPHCKAWKVHTHARMCPSNPNRTDPKALGKVGGQKRWVAPAAPAPAQPQKSAAEFLAERQAELKAKPATPEAKPAVVASPAAPAEGQAQASWGSIVTVGLGVVAAGAVGYIVYRRLTGARPEKQKGDGLPELVRSATPPGPGYGWDMELQAWRRSPAAAYPVKFNRGD